jgi:hypothetical protein
MKIISAITIALLPLAASAATLIVPASGTGPGAYQSHWQTQLTLHNTSASGVAVGVKFHDGNGAQAGDDIQLSARSTVTIEDIVATRFGRESAVGALELTIDDAAANKIAITSRTFNRSAAGEVGQDIPALRADAATAVDQTAVILGPADASTSRFNFGLYTPTNAVVRWDLIRADGSIAASVTENYAGGTQFQYNSAVFFGVAPANDDAVHATVVSGSMIGYGSVVNNNSNDPTYVGSITLHPDIRVAFLGVEYTRQTIVDIPDANHDGVLDQPLPINLSSAWSSSFQVVVDPSAGTPTFELVDAPAGVTLSSDGWVNWKPTSANVTSLKVRVTAGGVSDVITIPLRFV